MLHIYFISYILHSVTFVIFYSLEVNKGPARIQAEGIKTVNTMRQGLWETIHESVHCIGECASSFISYLLYISIFSLLSVKHVVKFLTLEGNI